MEMQDTLSPLEALPYEIFLVVLDYLSTTERIRLTRVSKTIFARVYGSFLQLTFPLELSSNIKATSEFMNNNTGYISGNSKINNTDSNRAANASVAAAVSFYGRVLRSPNTITTNNIVNAGAASFYGRSNVTSGANSTSNNSNAPSSAASFYGRSNSNRDANNANSNPGIANVVDGKKIVNINTKYVERSDLAHVIGPRCYFLQVINITHIDTSIEKMIKLLPSECPYIRHITISCSSTPSNEFCESLSLITTLNSVALERCSKKGAWSYLLKNLALLPNLQDLFIQHCAVSFGFDWSNHHQPFPSLLSLRLKEWPIRGTTNATEEIEMLIQGNSDHHLQFTFATLEELVLQSPIPINFGDMSISQSRFPSIQSFQVCGAGACGAIQDLVTLTNLDLHGCSGDFTAISKLQNLTALDLSSNRLQDNAELLSPLKLLRNLKFLDLSYNKIGDKSIVPLIKGLNRPPLTRLQLNNTKITVITLRLLPHLPLEELSICAIPGILKEHLSFLSNMDQLKTLYISSFYEEFLTEQNCFAFDIVAY